MAIATTVTSVAPLNTNVTPIPFVITFGAVVTGLELSEITVTGGTGVRLTDGGGGIWVLEVNPSTQGGSVSVSVPAGVATGPGPGFDTNAASNVLTRNFLSIRPLVTITHNNNPVTNAKKIPFTITFDRDVTGFAANDLTLVNARVYSFSGSGSQYFVKLSPLKNGEVQFSVEDEAATDIYGNKSKPSKLIVFTFDNTSLEEKQNATYGEIEDKDILLNFDVNSIKQVANINSLADCAKNIPQRLLDLATEKAFEIIRKNDNVKKLAAMVTTAQAAVEVVQNITDNIKALKEDPETFLSDVLAAKGLTGDALQAKIEGIIAKYPTLNNINEKIENALTSGICGQANFFPDGSEAPKPTLTPTDVLPEQIPGVLAGVQAPRYDTSPRDNYGAFSFQLKEQLEIDSTQEQSSERAKMISVLTTITMGYHDRISKTTDSSQDAAIHAQYLKNIDDELIRNASWPNDIKDNFKLRGETCAKLIQNNVDVIRTFFNRNTPASGEPVSVGITTYSGPDKDFTTFLDIKPEQRPAELTQYWESKGYNIQSQDAKLKARGIKTGTLNFSDAYRGAYGPLESDFTCASSRFPGGSVLLLKNKDGTIYDPTGRNPSGLYKVTDTGNAKLTYQKPDIFTSTPEFYKNTANVQVYLVSKGTQTGPQYRLAQQRYGSGSNVA